ncbi:MAG: hypothetical protein ACRCXB_27950 [Aeromonadaceae bacterium]
MWIEALVMLAFFGLTNLVFVWAIAELYGMYIRGKKLRKFHDERAKLGEMAFDWQIKAFNERIVRGE